MPLVLNGARYAVQIALINNMPDPVLEDTESQFVDLLGAASGDIPVRVSFFSLPGIPRCERAQERIATVYRGLDSLWDGRFDALIITGTEPRHADLRQEAYWASLVNVLNWAEENTRSTILSCLAAHASVLHSEGIPREPLANKQFGVFSFRKANNHRLTSGTGDAIEIPHSRWNEVPRGALTSCGYTILTDSAEAGVDLFLKQRRQSLFVYFQGHPEYRNETLLKEYRRDIRRFLKGARDTYPSQPHGYFDLESGEALSAFQAHAMRHRCEQTMAEFPEGAVARNPGTTWRSTAEDIYRNWLLCIESNRGETRPFSPVRCTRENAVTL
jgi:homoserine O-succinyltransferase